MKTELEYLDAESAVDGAAHIIVIGRAKRLAADDVTAWIPASFHGAWTAMLKAAQPGDQGCLHTSWGDGSVRRVTMGVLPEPCSRSNTPSRAHAVAALIRKAVTGKARTAIILALDTVSHGFAAGAAVARSLPVFSRKTSSESQARRFVRVGCVAPDGEPDLEVMQSTAESIRLATRLVDAPTSEMNTTHFIDIARETALRLDVDVTVFEGESTAATGLGGLWGVGKAATHPPALVILDYNPDKATRTIALVGKGVVYDTGGLSIKGKTHMPGMKTDMAGAAAVLATFVAAVEQRVPYRIQALLCLAENSVGPESVRPDDILLMYSGRTVEVNNTDAEGRLVLADGVAYASRHLDPDVIIDLATLTGAQLVATGRRHAASVCSDATLEAVAIAAGRVSGDLVHPMPFCPEFFRKEFKSKVADMKNSVKDRMNGQVSCAGHFIGEHLGDFKGPWLHLDIAGPALVGELATGYGIALLLEMFRQGI